MTVRDVRLTAEQVVRVVQNDIPLWDKDGERTLENLILWIAGRQDVVDRSLYQHPTTAGGTPALQINDHLQFRGAQYIDIPDTLPFTNQVSAMGWFRHVGAPGADYHILFGPTALEISIHTSDILRSGVHIDNVRHVANFGHPTISLLDGQWHHVGFSFDGTLMRRFIDGDYVGQTSLPAGSLSAWAPERRVGRFGSSTSYWANCDLYDLRIYSDAKSDEFFHEHHRRVRKAQVDWLTKYPSCRLR